MNSKKSTTRSFSLIRNVCSGKYGLSLLSLVVVLMLGTQLIAQTPTISGLTLAASSPGNLSDDDLTATFTSSNAVETATAWWNDGTYINSVYLPFEAGATNALLDFSGRHNDAYLSGFPDQVPTWDATGGHNGSGGMIFDGGDFLIVDNAIGINSDYTKTAWIYMTGDDFRNIISSTTNGATDHHFKVDPDSILNAGHSFGFAIVEDDVKLVEDTWYFVAVSFDFSTGEMILYKDGVEVDWGIVPQELRSIPGTSVHIGARDEQWGWKGRMDEPKVFNRALSPEQIMSLYTTNNLLLAQETDGLDGWAVDVTPFSATEVGATYESNIINIIIPQINGLTLSATSPDVLTTDDLILAYTEAGGVVETVTTWYQNGTPESLLYLPFEGGTITALRDFSGNDNHPSRDSDRDLHPTWDATGGHNGTGAFTFDGDDYLYAGTIFPLNSDYTKSAWINESGSGFRNIMSSVIHADNNHTFKVNADGTLGAGHSNGVSTVQAAITSGPWSFVAVTFDYETGEMILYINGAEVDRATETFTSVVDDTVLIGALNWTYGFQGSIDDARLYDRALSPEQISSLYTNGNTGMAAEETSGGDEWYVEVVPFSQTEYGNTYTSNTLTVTSLVVSPISDQTIQEGSTFDPITLDDYVVDYQYDDDELVWTSSGSSELVVTIDDLTRVATVAIPNADWYGSELITFTVTNPDTEFNTIDVTFTVQNVNDAPVLTEILDQSTNEDIDLTRTVTFTDADDLDTHTITVVSGNANVTVTGPTGNTSSSTYDLVPADNWSGTAQITVTVTDNGTNPSPLSDIEIYTLTVVAVNDAPVIAEIGDQSTDEDTDLTRTVTFTDIEGSDTHTITVVGDANVSVTGPTGNTSGSTYDLVPADDWHGTATITVTVTDNGTPAMDDVETYILTVDPINDPPVITEIGDQVTIEDTPLTGLSVDFVDPDADTHIISVVSLEPNVTVVGPTGNTSGSTYDLVPAAEWAGTAQITVSVTENITGGISDTEIYALTVGAVNDPPVLVEIGDQSVDEDNSVIGLAVEFSDLDPDDNHNIAVVSSEPGVSVANLIGNITGSTYDLVPDADWNGSTQITVTVTDDGTDELFDFEVYTFTVNPINDAPSLISLSNSSVEENVAMGTVVGLLSSTDADIGDTHTYTFVFEGGDEDADNLFFEIVGDELRVNAELDHELQNSFSLLLQSDDGNGGTLTQQITVTVDNVWETSIGDDSENLMFKVYPVPAVDRLTVEVDNPENAELLLEIFSNSGVLVHSEHTVHGNTIDLSEFSKGMYILRIHGESISETRKIIVGNK